MSRGSRASGSIPSSSATAASYAAKWRSRIARCALELVELHERDRGEDVGEVRLVAGHRDVVERAVAAAHDAEVVDRRREVVPVRRDEPTLAGGDVLRGVEREAGQRRRARRACVLGRPTRPRGPRPRRPELRAPRAARGRTAGRRGGPAEPPSSAASRRSVPRPDRDSGRPRARPRTRAARPRAR